MALLQLLPRVVKSCFLSCLVCLLPLSLRMLSSAASVWPM